MPLGRASAWASHSPELATSTDTSPASARMVRRDRKGRNCGVPSGGVDGDLGVKPWPKTQLFDLQIGPNDSQFLFDFVKRSIGAQEIAKDVGEIQHQPPRFDIGPINGAVERIQRIE